MPDYVSLTCPKCQKTFKNKSALSAHKQVHTYEETEPPGDGKPAPQVEGGLPGGDGEKPPPEPTVAKKEIPTPPIFRLTLTVKVDWDNLYFFYRAKAGGFDGDISDYLNYFAREGYQVRGLKLAEVFDPATAKKLMEEFLPEEANAATA